MQIITIRLTTLTPLWTGGVNRDCDRLHETSIIGSLRWWYEALIRGLGVTACDPTDSKCEGENHCATCELFGCTGWSRKFRLLVLDENDSIAQSIESGKSYTFKFIPLKSICDEEAFLLFHTIRIISDIGSIGGKTVLKPSENISKNKKARHADYGLIKLTSTYNGKNFRRDEIIGYLKEFQRRANVKQSDEHPNFNPADRSAVNGANVKQSDEHPALSNFWFLQNYYLKRTQINRIVGRDSEGRYNNASVLQRWMGGDVGESKKIFSFHCDKAKRTWGYAKDAQLQNVIKLLTDNGIKNIETGECLLQSIFKEGN